MTLLCVDCGNTRLKWGLHSGDRWIAQSALPVAEAESLDEILPKKPDRIVACNVAGPAVAQALVLAAGRLAAPLAWVHAHASQCGVTNRYEHPERLGADRWAALIGARHLHGFEIIGPAGRSLDAQWADIAEAYNGCCVPGFPNLWFTTGPNTGVGTTSVVFMIEQEATDN